MVLAGSLAVASSAFAQEGGGQGGRGGMTGGGMPGAQAAPNETGQAYGAQSTGEAVFQFDPETDSLIVIADDETNDKIREVIERLDRPAPQVLINVVFLEVTHSDGLDLGLEGSVEVDGRSGDNNDYTLSDFWGLAAETQGAFFRVLEDDFTMTIRAYAEKSKLEILSRPSILARNNQEAVITVGQEVPFIRDSRITNDGQTINTIEYEDIGIILRVTPYVGENGVVEMHLLPEISSLTGDSVQISETVNAPVFAKRSAETRVIVPDGRTVAIGGLMEDSYIESVRKIPLLGDIPWLGALFRRTIKEKAKTELIIFLTPQVVPQTDLLDAATRDEIKRGELSRKSFSDEQFQRYSLPMDQDVPEDTEE
ncbi:MAG: type II secretion system protein GspD [Candidatus Sumerlaeia bacterium]